MWSRQGPTIPPKSISNLDITYPRGLEVSIPQLMSQDTRTLVSAMLENSNFLENLDLSSIRVKSGNLGHPVNSDIHLQTVEIQIRLS